jgi:hypothetical protein
MMHRRGKMEWGKERKRKKRDIGEQGLLALVAL